MGQAKHARQSQRLTPRAEEMFARRGADTLGTQLDTRTMLGTRAGGSSSPANPVPFPRPPELEVQSRRPRRIAHGMAREKMRPTWTAGRRNPPAGSVRPASSCRCAARPSSPPSGIIHRIWPGWMRWSGARAGISGSGHQRVPAPGGQASATPAKQFRRLLAGLDPGPSGLRGGDNGGPAGGT